MQIDMHYHGTFSLARAAGINKESARKIAHAAQFVDDNVAAHVDDHDDGSQLYAIPTAHHAGDLSNREADDQRHIWVPFHFIPGAQGSKFTEKLICTKNSDIAQIMIANHASQSHQDFSLELLGIGVHVYEDTFAHYGFSGVSSRRNKVVGDSFVLTQSDAVVESIMGQTFGAWINKHGSFLKNIRSHISGAADLYSGSLGHGAVSTYPDQPFLQWQFTYEQSGETVYHDNQATYLECAEALYAIFQDYAEKNPSCRGDTSVPWSDIADKIAWIFSQEGNKHDRADVWKLCSQDGNFGTSEEIPEYESDAWNEQCDEFGKLDSGSDGIELDVHRFYRAASYHIHYVLRELLPAHGVMIV